MTLRGKVLRGSFWVVAFRWAARFLGLVNVAIIARILSPEDFGLVAMGMLVVGFIEAWLAFGVENACVQRRELTREHLDTAWSMRIIQGVAVTLLIAAAAPFAATYFKDARVTLLLWVLCSGILIASLANIGVVLFRREMDFQAEFKLQIGGKLIAFVIGVTAALLLRNYWALVIGVLSGYAAATVLSYVMHPYRPRWQLSKWRELWNFSKWMFLLNIAQFAETRADEAVVGRMGPAEELGLYVVASDFGQMPVNEIAAPINRVLFPAFAEVQADADRSRVVYLRTLEAVASITVPAGVGLAMVTKPAIAIVLGDKWLPAATIMSLIALYAVCRSLASTTTSLIVAQGRPRISAALSCTGLIVFLALAVPLGLHGGTEGVAGAKALAALIAALASFGIVTVYSLVSATDIAKSLLRPVVASICMALALWSLPDWSQLGHVMNLGLCVVSGAIAYSVTSVVLWILMGRPEGPESMALAATSKFVDSLT